MATAHCEVSQWAPEIPNLLGPRRQAAAATANVQDAERREECEDNERGCAVSKQSSSMPRISFRLWSDSHLSSGMLQVIALKKALSIEAQRLGKLCVVSVFTSKFLCSLNLLLFRLERVS